MPRAGGEAGKLGNRYEQIWTVGCVLEVAIGREIGITVEPIGADGLGVEFVLRSRDGSRNFHSVKRQRSDGEWTSDRLTHKDASTGRSVLGDLWLKLSDGETNACTFVSSTGANDVRELEETAKRRPTAESFLHELHSVRSQRLSQAFNRDILSIEPDRDIAFRCLRSTRIVLVDETTLIQQVEQHIELLIYRTDGQHLSPKEVRLLLGDLVLETLGSEISQADIWAYLARFGYAKRDWVHDTPLLTKINRQNASYVDTTQLELINGRSLERNEVEAITAHLIAPHGPQTVLASAAAGAGKSCVIAEVVNRLESENIPVLAFRIDRFGNAHSTTDIGRQLDIGLSPAVVLAGIANGGHCVLVVDQLDAVSQISGRYPHLIDVFDNLQREVASYPNMRLLVACRTFDLDNDHRLRRLKEPKSTLHVKIELLSETDIDRALEEAGYKSLALNTLQKQLLQVPLHLGLFISGIDNSRPDATFQDVGDLFDRYWRRKEKAVSERLGRTSDWSTVIDRMCSTMSANLTLYVPEFVLDDWSETVTAMLTEHVLIPDGKQVRFFHESFFDYSFARRFSASGKSVTDLLRGDEQHLFRRAQVRQILTFLRHHSRADYLPQLHATLCNDEVRFHIRRMTCAWLGTLQDPGRDEWSIVGPLLHHDLLGRHLRVAIRNSLPWFDLLNQEGVIRDWLHSPDEELVHLGFWFVLLGDVQKKRSNAVAALLDPFRGAGGAWNDRFRIYFEFEEPHHSPEMQRLFLQLMDDGVFEEPVEAGSGRRRTWWERLRESAKDAPSFALEAVCRWLDKAVLPLTDLAEVRRELDRYDNAAASVLSEIAGQQPQAYASEILPRIARLCDKWRHSRPNRLDIDQVFGIRTNGSAMHIDDALLADCRTALETIAKTKPELAASFVDSVAHVDTDVIAMLRLATYVANPGYFSSHCLDFLVASPRHLRLGYGVWSGGGNGHAAISREAIESCLPHLTEDHLRQLEDAALGYADDDDAEYGEFVQRLLLESIGDQALSSAGVTRLEALRSRFPHQELKLPPRRGGGMQVAVSPIAPDVAKCLTDDEWLAAMREYDYGWESERRHEQHPHGSAVELSRTLGPLARQQRARFAALVERMEDTIRSEYFEAILDGICGSGGENLDKEARRKDDEEFALLDTEVVLAVIRRLHRLPDRPCGRSICSAFERIAKRVIADDDLKLIIYYATEDPDPASDELLIKGASSNRDICDDAYFRGYNCVRGRAARAIEALMFGHYGRVALLVPVVRRMADDPSIAVRTCVIDALCPLLDHDRDEAVQLLKKVCSLSDILLGTTPFAEFVRYASSTHYPELRDLLTTGLKSHLDTAVSVAAKQTCLAAFVDATAKADAASVRRGSELERVAAAEVYAFNVNDAEVGRECQSYLNDMFNDQTATVREQAAACFSHVAGQELASLEELIKGYLESRAFPAPHDWLPRHLEESDWKLPDITLRLAERFLQKSGDKSGDFATDSAFIASSVSTLVVRLYSQTDDNEIRSRCLDLIDEMERLATYGISAKLAEIDR